MAQKILGGELGVLLRVGPSRGGTVPPGGLGLPIPFKGNFWELGGKGIFHLPKGLGFIARERGFFSLPTFFNFFFGPGPSVGNFTRWVFLPLGLDSKRPRLGAGFPFFTGIFFRGLKTIFGGPLLFSLPLLEWFTLFGNWRGRS